MDRVTFAQYSQRLDSMLGTIADHEEREADYMMWSQQECFNAQDRAEFHATSLRYRDVLIPLAKKEYVELHDHFKRLGEMSFRVADYEQSAADNLDYSQQKCFDVETRGQFRAAYLRYKDVLIPQAKKKYEELHDQLLTMFGVEDEQ